MNLKIQKFQGGGSSSSYFYYQPLSFAQAQPQQEDMTSKLAKAINGNKKSSNDEDKGKITDKDMLGLLKDIDGLPSDTLRLYKRIQDFYGNPLLNSGTSSVSGSAYQKFVPLMVQVAQEAKAAKFNKELFSKTQDSMWANGSANEMALTDQGQVVIDRDGKLDVVTLDTWLKNKGKYHTMTNQDIMVLRAEKYSYNNGLLNIVNGSTSLDKITSKIQGIVKEAGESSATGYLSSTMDTKVAQQVLQELQAKGIPPEGLTMKGVYKFTNADNARQLQNLISYTWDALTTKEKALLTAHSGKITGGKDMLLKIMAGYTKTNASIDYQDDLNEDGTKRSAKKDKESEDNWEEKIKTNQIVDIQNGYAGQPTSYSFMPDDAHAAITMYGDKYGAIRTPNNETIGATSIANLLAASGLQNVSDTRSIYFGPNKVSAEQLNEIAYLNHGGIRVILPTTKDSYGNKVPDFDLIPRFEKAWKQINALPKPQQNASPQQVQEYANKLAKILRDYDLAEYVTADGQLNRDKVGAFLVVDGQASAANVGELRGVKEIAHDNDAYDNLSKMIYGTTEKGELKGEVQGKKTWANDDMYQAPVYIPITNFSLGASAPISNDITLDQAHRTQSLSQNSPAIQNIKGTSSQGLLN